MHSNVNKQNDKNETDITSWTDELSKVIHKKNKENLQKTEQFPPQSWLQMVVSTLNNISNDLSRCQVCTIYHFQWNLCFTPTIHLHASHSPFLRTSLHH